MIWVDHHNADGETKIFKCDESSKFFLQDLFLGKPIGILTLLDEESLFPNVSVFTRKNIYANRFGY